MRRFDYTACSIAISQVLPASHLTCFSDCPWSAMLLWDSTCSLLCLSSLVAASRDSPCLLLVLSSFSAYHPPVPIPQFPSPSKPPARSAAAEGSELERPRPSPPELGRPSFPIQIPPSHTLLLSDPPSSCLMHQLHHCQGSLSTVLDVSTTRLKFHPMPQHSFYRIPGVLGIYQKDGQKSLGPTGPCPFIPRLFSSSC